MHESSALASSIPPVTSSDFERKPKAWAAVTASADPSWGDLRIEARPRLHKLSVSFTAPLSEPTEIMKGVTLPAAYAPVSPSGTYALCINRYNKLVLSEDPITLERIAAALAERPDVLTGDESGALSSAVISGRRASDLLARVISLNLAALADGGYACTQFGHARVIVHRDGAAFWLHWPEMLTEYVWEWIGSVMAVA
jgi:sarcosine oxidase gamma subunit